MSIIDHIYLLESIHHYIDHKCTGTPKEFSNKLNISERTLYRILENLKDLGAEIYYSNERATYYYKNVVQIKFNLQIDSATTKVKGGRSIKFDLSLPNMAVRFPYLY